MKIIKLTYIDYENSRIMEKTFATEINYEDIKDFEKRLVKEFHFLLLDKTLSRQNEIINLNREKL